MKKWLLFYILFLCIFVPGFGIPGVSGPIEFSSGNFHFQWDLENDMATTTLQPSGHFIWKGSLLPAFVIVNGQGTKEYLKAEVADTQLSAKDESATILLDFPAYASGKLVLTKEQWGIAIEEFTLHWTGRIPEIIEMHFGTALVSGEGAAFLNADEIGFRGNWSAAGFCVPGAKEGTAQSFFRMWDFGQTTIALGNYGPSLGTLYGAAFPRPVLGFSMGNNKGWTAFGAGSIPDGAMLLQLQSTHGHISYVYREDLWGAGTRERQWEHPLHISFGENPWLAFRAYFKSLPKKEALPDLHSKSLWNTWGNWRNREYHIPPMVDFAAKLGAELFIVDDPWEESQGLGKPSLERFPNFYGDMKYINNAQMQCGIWETLGWISDTLEAGLTSDDLIVNTDGIPCKTNWSFDPLSSGSYCIDISSERSREFLKTRTTWAMENINPKIIKLDFGYAMPAPNMGVPRNPELRGERYGYALLKLIVEAAKRVDPNVTIMYYGINPLFLNAVDMVSLDDQGDLWYEIKQGHDQWSTWASLLSDRQVVISGSSSYDWHSDDEVILNTFILGTPGAVLATHLEDGSPVPDKYLNRRLAVNTWYRKNIQWEPAWLNSHVGDLSHPTEIRCWGRQDIIKGKQVLTALVLNGPKDEDLDVLEPITWQGRWAVISQTDEDIFTTSKLALVPFDAGRFSIQRSQKPASVERLNIQGCEAWSDWRWEDGTVIFDINEQQLEETAGFIIHTN